MKLRHPSLINAAGFGVAGLLSAWFATLRYREYQLVPGVSPNTPGMADRYIYAFWHESILVPAMAYGHRNIKILISQHADGEFIAQVVRHLGFTAARGSTTRGGAAALRQMIAGSQRSHLAITPDGPRGPRRIAQLGAVKLASETGRSIVPCGFGSRYCWRARSWDRFVVPHPLSPCVGVAGVPIHVPPGLGRGELELHRVRLEEAMNGVTAIAEERAGRERW